jgi:hypothetical protein
MIFVKIIIIIFEILNFELLFLNSIAFTSLCVTHRTKITFNCVKKNTSFFILSFEK